VEKLWFHSGQKIWRECWRLLQDLNTNDATTSTLSSTESEAESPTHSTMDATFINTSFELCSVSPLKRHGKSKQTQAAETRHKILKSANVLLGYEEQEKASVQICEMQDDVLENDNKEKIQHSDRLCKAISEKIQSVDWITKFQLFTLIPNTWLVSWKSCTTIWGYQISFWKGKKNEKGARNFTTTREEQR